MDGNNICEYSGLPSTQSYETKPQTQTEGAGVGGEVEKGNFIDSSQISLESPKSSDWMYNWIKKHKNR